MSRCFLEARRVGTACAPSQMRPALRSLSLLGAAACACGWAWLELRRRRRHLSLCLKYCLDPQRGFMLPVATALPEPFAAWERIALDLPALNRSARLRAAVDRAEPVDPLAVAALGPCEQRRAYVLFAAIAHSYVNGGSVPWAKLDSASAAASPAVASSAPMPELPAQLAAPWRAVCAELGVPCVFNPTPTPNSSASPSPSPNPKPKPKPSPNPKPKPKPKPKHKPNPSPNPNANANANADPNPNQARRESGLLMQALQRPNPTPRPNPNPLPAP